MNKQVHFLTVRQKKSWEVLLHIFFKKYFRAVTQTECHVDSSERTDILTFPK